MAETVDNTADPAETVDNTSQKVEGLTARTDAFGKAMTRAFTQATAGGKSFESVLARLAMQMSSLALTQAIRPIAGGFGGGFGGLFSAGAGAAMSSGAPEAGAAPSNVTVQVQTPDLGSFRRSESYLTGQIARAVARGQRTM